MEFLLNILCSLWSAGSAFRSAFDFFTLVLNGGLNQIIFSGAVSSFGLFSSSGVLYVFAVAAVSESFIVGGARHSGRFLRWMTAMIWVFLLLMVCVL